MGRSIRPTPPELALIRTIWCRSWHSLLSAATQAKPDWHWLVWNYLRAPVRRRRLSLRSLGPIHARTPSYRRKERENAVRFFQSTLTDCPRIVHLELRPSLEFGPC